MPPTRSTERNPFDVDLTESQTTAFVDQLAEELDDARSARSELDEAAEYWNRLYEQKPSRYEANMPWPDAADLTSFIATEKVDSLHARLLRTIFTEPIWTVEGWGEAAARAPLVEEFHQWKAEEERLQTVVDKALLMSLIYPMAIHEVVEGTETRHVRERVLARLALDPVTGGPMLDEQGQPILERDADGDVISATEPGPGVAETVVDHARPIRSGPVHKVVPFRDFYVLPGHARAREDLWGFCKRFYRRLGVLKAEAKAGVYDVEAVDRLSESGEFAGTEEDERSGVTVTHLTGDRAEKELWECLILWDFDDGTGERWYLATVHMPTRTVLRIQHDDLGAKRFILYTPIPRSDSVYGYSYVGDKLITVIEEHTAIRNMRADKYSMAAMSPILRSSGSLWDPDSQPMGPKSVITVNSASEIQPLVLQDVPRGVVEAEREVLQAAERLGGINDTAAGQTSQPGTTLGEVQLVAQQSFVRMDTIINRIQEELEDLAQVRHAIWQRTLQEQADGEDLPAKVLTGLEHRGVQLPTGAVTADMLAGAFKFKPRGSVESADLNRKRQDLVQFFQFLAQLAQTSPMIAQRFQDPAFMNALLEEAIRVFAFENRQQLLGAPPGPAPAGAGQNPAGLEQLVGLLGGGGQPPGPAGVPNPVLSGDDMGGFGG